MIIMIINTLSFCLEGLQRYFELNRKVYHYTMNTIGDILATTTATTTTEMLIDKTTMMMRIMIYYYNNIISNKLY